MQVDMSGRVALVTGGSKGLGYAMASQFAKCGASVALLARSTDQVAAAAAAIASDTGAQVMGFTCDVSDAEQIKNTWGKVINEFSQVDILVNNAGAARHGKFEELTDEDWQHDIDLKLMAAIRMTRLAFPGMKERRWGRIINMLNTAAKTPGARSAPTSVSRAAGMALTKVLAGEGAPHNILVNGLNIGLIKSDQIQRLWEASDRQLTFEEFVANAGKAVPLGRYGEAAECANLACLLCSDDCGFVTGTSINVDGNMSPVM